MSVLSESSINDGGGAAALGLHHGSNNKTADDVLLITAAEFTEARFTLGSPSSRLTSL